MQGVFGTHNQNHSKSQFVKMKNILRESNWVITGEKEFDSLYFGSFSNMDGFVKLCQKDGVYIMVSGEIIEPDNYLEIIRQTYQSAQWHELAQLDGNFNIIIYDSNIDKLILVNDRFATSKIYYTSEGNALNFSSRIAPLIKTLPAKKINLQAVYEFHLYRYYLGEKTFFENLKQLLPGSILIYEKRRVTTKKYWTFGFSEPTDFDNDLSKKLLTEAWHKAVEKRINDLDPVIIPLSGGMDSRAILAAALEVVPASKIVTFSYGNKGSYDLEIATKVAHTAGVNNIVIDSEQCDFEKLTSTVFENNEGMFSCLMTLPFDGFSKIAELNSVLVSGYIGDLIFGSNMYPEMFDISIDDIKNEAKIIDSKIRFHDDALVSNLMVDSFEVSDIEMYLKIFEKTTKLTTAFFNQFLDNHVYNFTHHSCLVHKELFHYRTPFLDNELIRLIQNVPAHYRQNEKLYQEIMLENYPKLFELPIKNLYGTQMTHSKGFRKLKKRFYVRPLWWANKLSAMSFGRHLFNDKTKNYLDYDGLLRSNIDFRQLVVQCLDSAKKRAIYNAPYINHLLKSHLTGRRNYSYLFGQIMTIEKLFQEYVEN